MAVIAVTDENFETEVLQESKTVLLDFWAVWCGHCNVLFPTVEQIAEEQHEVKVCKVDIDNNPSLTEKFEIEMIPTLVVMKNGKEIKRSSGVIPKEAIFKMLQS